MKRQQLNETLQLFIAGLAQNPDPERLPALDLVTTFINEQLQMGRVPALNFICTHNSRRSQLSQVWATVASHYFGIRCLNYSGGVEVTEFNERAVASLKRSGFQIFHSGEINPTYEIGFARGSQPIEAFSKLYNDPRNPSTQFAAVMTCSDADENCPVIVGADARIGLRYEDPKAYDGTSLETEMYDTRSRQIASEMLYIFSNVKST